MQEELETPYALGDDQVAFFREHGFVRLPGVLSPALLEHFRQHIASFVHELKAGSVARTPQDVLDPTFSQVPNVWARAPVVRGLILSPRLGRIAAELMESSGIRLYHDQAIFKEPSLPTDPGGYTPVHVDQFYWPFQNEKACTAWIPLHTTTLQMGPLAFAAGSQRFAARGELQLFDQSDQNLQAQIEAVLAREGSRLDVRPFEAGDVSFHSGWTYHGAGPNHSDRVREAMTVLYMDHEMRLAEPRNNAQHFDREAWVPGIEVGEIIASPLNPVLYSRCDPQAPHNGSR